MVVLGGRAVSYERGTSVCLAPSQPRRHQRVFAVSSAHTHVLSTEHTHLSLSVVARSHTAVPAHASTPCFYCLSRAIVSRALTDSERCRLVRHGGLGALRAQIPTQTCICVSSLDPSRGGNATYGIVVTLSQPRRLTHPTSPRRTRIFPVSLLFSLSSWAPRP